MSVSLEHAQKRLDECRKETRQFSSTKPRSRSSSSSSSSSTSSSTSGDDDSNTTSGSSTSETGSSCSSSDSDTGSNSSGDKMATGNDRRESCRDRGGAKPTAAVPSNVSHQNSCTDGDVAPRKHLPPVGNITDGESRFKPEVEIVESASGEPVVADIVCLSPSKIEDQGNTRACSVIPFDMTTSGYTDNGRRDRIRIVLNGKQIPAVNDPAMGSGSLASQSLRNISIYSDDDEVDCNDDGRSLDRRPEPAVNQLHLNHQETVSKQPAEPDPTPVAEVFLSENVSTVEDSEPNQGDTRKTGTPSLSFTADIPNSANVDDPSRSSGRRQRQSSRHREERRERHRGDSSGTKSRKSPEVIIVHDSAGRSSRKNSTEPRRRIIGGSSERSDDTNIVAADRFDTRPHRTATADRHLRYEATRSCRRSHNQVNRSRSRSRSPSRLGRTETGSGRSRSRTKSHHDDDVARTRTEPDDRQRSHRRSSRESISASGHRSERPSSSRMRPEVELGRCWRQDDVIAPPTTVPLGFHGYHQARLTEKSFNFTF